MFSHTFQGGGLGVEVFSSSGKEPAKLWKCTQHIHRVYDRTVKGFVYLLEKGATTQMSIPADPSRDTLGLVHPILVLQLRLQSGKHVGVELIVLDDKGNKRRLHLSSTFREIVCNELHVQFPLNFESDERWMNVVLDLDGLVRSCYRGFRFHGIAYIALKPVCRVRKVFTLYQSDRNSRISIPAMYDFPSGTVFVNKFYPEGNHIFLNDFPGTDDLVPLPPPKRLPDKQKEASGEDDKEPVPENPPAIAGSDGLPTEAAIEVEQASKALKLLKLGRIGSRDVAAPITGNGPTDVHYQESAPKIPMEVSPKKAEETIITSPKSNLNEDFNNATAVLRSPALSQTDNILSLVPAFSADALLAAPSSLSLSMSRKLEGDSETIVFPSLERLQPDTTQPPIERLFKEPKESSPLNHLPYGRFNITSPPERSSLDPKLMRTGLLERDTNTNGAFESISKAVVSEEPYRVQALVSSSPKMEDILNVCLYGNRECKDEITESHKIFLGASTPETRSASPPTTLTIESALGIRSPHNDITLVDLPSRVEESSDNVDNTANNSSWLQAMKEQLAELEAKFVQEYGNAALMALNARHYIT